MPIMAAFIDFADIENNQQFNQNQQRFLQNYTTRY